MNVLLTIHTCTLEDPEGGGVGVLQARIPSENRVKLTHFESGTTTTPFEN
jgi:hypothetical protein